MRVRHARCVLATSVALLASCGDPVAPAMVTSAAFEVTARFSSNSLSMSNPADSVLVFITVRNPLSIRATVTDRGNLWPYSQWEVNLWSTSPDWDGGMMISRGGPGNITLEPGADTTHVFVLQRSMLPNVAPGRFDTYAGVLGHHARRRDFHLTP